MGGGAGLESGAGRAGKAAACHTQESCDYGAIGHNTQIAFSAVDSLLKNSNWRNPGSQLQLPIAASAPQSSTSHQWGWGPWVAVTWQVEGAPLPPQTEDGWPQQPTQVCMAWDGAQVLCVKRTLISHIIALLRRGVHRRDKGGGGRPLRPSGSWHAVDGGPILGAHHEPVGSWRQPAPGRPCRYACLPPCRFKLQVGRMPDLESNPPRFPGHEGYRYPCILGAGLIPASSCSAAAPL